MIAKKLACVVVLSLLSAPHSSDATPIRTAFLDEFLADLNTFFSRFNPPKTKESRSTKAPKEVEYAMEPGSTEHNLVKGIVSLWPQDSSELFTLCPGAEIRWNKLKEPFSTYAFFIGFICGSEGFIRKKDPNASNALALYNLLLPFDCSVDNALLSFADGAVTGYAYQEAANTLNIKIPISLSSIKEDDIQAHYRCGYYLLDTDALTHKSPRVIKAVRKQNHTIDMTKIAFLAANQTRIRREILATTLVKDPTSFATKDEFVYRAQQLLSESMNQCATKTHPDAAWTLGAMQLLVPVASMPPTHRRISPSPEFVVSIEPYTVTEVLALARSLPDPKPSPKYRWYAVGRVHAATTCERCSAEEHVKTALLTSAQEWAKTLLYYQNTCPGMQGLEDTLKYYLGLVDGYAVATAKPLETQSGIFYEVLRHLDAQQPLDDLSVAPTHPCSRALGHLKTLLADVLFSRPLSKYPFECGFFLGKNIDSEKDTTAMQAYLELLSDAFEGDNGILLSFLSGVLQGFAYKRVTLAKGLELDIPPFDANTIQKSYEEGAAHFITPPETDGYDIGLIAQKKSTLKAGVQPPRVLVDLHALACIAGNDCAKHQMMLVTAGIGPFHVRNLILLESRTEVLRERLFDEFSPEFEALKLATKPDFTTVAQSTIKTLTAQPHVPICYPPPVSATQKDQERKEQRKTERAAHAAIRKSKQAARTRRLALQKNRRRTYEQNAPPLPSDPVTEDEINDSNESLSESDSENSQASESTKPDPSLTPPPLATGELDDKDGWIFKKVRGKTKAQQALASAMLKKFQPPRRRGAKKHTQQPTMQLRKDVKEFHTRRRKPTNIAPTYPWALKHPSLPPTRASLEAFPPLTEPQFSLEEYIEYIAWEAAEQAAWYTRWSMEAERFTPRQIPACQQQAYNAGWNYYNTSRSKPSEAATVLAKTHQVRTSSCTALAKDAFDEAAQFNQAISQGFLDGYYAAEHHAQQPPLPHEQKEPETVTAK